MVLPLVPVIPTNLPLPYLYESSISPVTSIFLDINFFTNSRSSEIPGDMTTISASSSPVGFFPKLKITFLFEESLAILSES